MLGQGFFDNGRDSECAEQERQMFVRWINDAEKYFGGLFEYCNRYDGIRLHISLDVTRTRVRYASLSLDGAWSPYTEEQVTAANARMAAVL